MTATLQTQGVNWTYIRRLSIRGNIRVTIVLKNYFLITEFVADAFSYKFFLTYVIQQSL